MDRDKKGDRKRDTQQPQTTKRWRPADTFSNDIQRRLAEQNPLP